MKCIRKTRAGRLCRNEAGNGRKTCACHSAAQRRKRRHRARMKEVESESSGNKRAREDESIPTAPPPQRVRMEGFGALPKSFLSMVSGRLDGPDVRAMLVADPGSREKIVDAVEEELRQTIPDLRAQRANAESAYQASLSLHGIPRTAAEVRREKELHKRTNALLKLSQDIGNDLFRAHRRNEAAMIPGF
eukprot:jgi/Mesvir1/7747/Mv25284-RA.1